MTSTTNVPFDEPKRRAGRRPSPRRGERVSLSEGLNGHRNSLGVLRLILASMVIFSHAFPTGGWGEDPSKGWSNGQETIGGFAVVGFFAISGYLIAKSGVSADILQFLWRRGLRIFPAFWAVLLVGALIVGPIAWRLSGNGLRDYIGSGPIMYVFQNADLTIRQWGIYDIFVTTTPYGEAVEYSVFNGSLWTLALEWGCYMLIAALLVLGVLRHARWAVPALAGVFWILSVVYSLAPQLVAMVAPVLADPNKIKLTLVFLIGSSLAMYSRKVPLSDLLGIGSAVVMVVTLLTGGWVQLGYPAFAYFILWLAARLPKRIQWIGAKNDYSYGMYVYGFLVQQFTAFLGWHLLGYWPWVGLTILVTAGCAWLSWHGIEKRAMALKDWGPGRGLDWLGQRRERRSVNAAAGGLVPSNVDPSQDKGSTT
ncbi:MAG TPA: acyltransferase [Plantibacter sp.]|uniref:acyltransferase family protein n=1 Tax=unclassified Plantibacter TaxID=2624265 RepID=UPI002C893299|nr:acyltransferase [Plantibacter sp.]